MVKLSTADFTINLDVCICVAPITRLSAKHLHTECSKHGKIDVQQSRHHAENEMLSSVLAIGDV